MKRREFLLATGGLTLSPLMSSMLTQIEARAAGGSSKPPMRFVFCLKSNGLWAELIQPQGMEKLLPKFGYGDESSKRGEIYPPADLQIAEGTKLNPLMASLEPFSDRISILQGINSGFSVYHKACYQALGGFQARRRDTSEVCGPTVDSLLAKALHAPVPHLCLGQEDESPSGVAYVPTSAEDKDKPIAFYTQPARAYKELFGVIDQGAARNTYDTHTDILDFFTEDAKRLRAEVAASEREQLDRYLGAFESIRKSRNEVEAMSDKLRAHAPEPPEQVDPRAQQEVAAGNVDIAIAALLSGLTNVVTIQFDQIESGSLHSQVGHGQCGDVLGARKKITGSQLEQIGRIAAALEAVPEGDGTMLDNTVIIYTSDNGETHHSRGVNYPIMLLGDLGGRLKRRRFFVPDIELDKDGNRNRSLPNCTRLGDVWATLLAAAGQPYEKFGRPINGVPHTPIASLLT